MKYLPLLSITVLLTTWAPFAEGNNFMFDESCTPDMISFIQTSLNNAVAMGNAAYAAIQGTPSPAIQTVLDYLFDPTVNAGLGVKYGIKVFMDIDRFHTQVTENKYLTFNDIKFYCDESRVIWRSTPPATWYDEDINEELEEGPACGLSGQNLMYAHAVKENSWYQIQICPATLSYAMPVQYKWTALLDLRFWSKVTSTLVAQLVAVTSYAPIDAVSLFDKVLLHELTHANGNYLTDDVVGSSSYGWANCRRLSSTVTAGGMGNLKGPEPWGPELNADTFALFGSIAWQLANGRITGMNADGSFTTT